MKEKERIIVEVVELHPLDAFALEPHEIEEGIAEPIPVGTRFRVTRESFEALKEHDRDERVKGFLHGGLAGVMEREGKEELRNPFFYAVRLKEVEA